MFIVDERRFVKLEAGKNVPDYEFVVKEMCAKGMPTFLVTLNDEFFCQVDSTKEASDEIEYFADEKGLIEVIF